MEQTISELRRLLKETEIARAHTTIVSIQTDSSTQGAKLMNLLQDLRDGRR